MNESRKRNSFFTISFGFVLVDVELPYDLYINSSSNVERERFVRIFPRNGALSKNDLKEFKRKYHQLYVLEDQRHLYLKSMVQSDNVEDVKKTEVIKDSAIHYLSGLFDDEKEFTTELLEETIEGCRESVESMVHVIQDYKINEVRDLIANLSFHDFYTYDHSINVSMYCINLYKMLKPEATKKEMVMAGMGGMLHDLGKIKIPTTIINKPDKLKDEEFAIIKKHPDWGKDLLQEQGCSDCEGIDFDVLKRVVHEHHENYDGSGYPNKISGKDIHLLARVTAIADFFDAITSKRSYHEVLSIEEAVGIMERTAGKKIDPKLFEVFSQNTAKVVKKRAPTRELPDDFDPCQPHRILPFKKIEIKTIDVNLFEKKDDYGKIDVKTDLFKVDKEVGKVSSTGETEKKDSGTGTMNRVNGKKAKKDDKSIKRAKSFSMAVHWVRELQLGLLKREIPKN